MPKVPHPGEPEPTGQEAGRRLVAMSPHSQPGWAGLLDEPLDKSSPDAVAALVRGDDEMCATET